MGDRVAQERAYQKAAEIADALLASGVPVIGFDSSDMGAKVAISFQLRGAKYGCRVPVEEASVQRFRDYYEAVA
jgi:hypothetical protein